MANWRNITKKIKASPRTLKEAKKTAKKVLDEEKAKLLSEFNNHPVTQEIEMGPLAPNISNTLNGYGNLFTFIGFNKGHDPIETVRLMLSQLVRLKKVSINQGSAPRIEIQYQAPTNNDFKVATPLPWESGRSWVIGIETGISGFGSYMYEKTYKGSRSGMGFQAKSGPKLSFPMQIRSGRFKNVKYMSNMLRNFYKKLRERTK